MPSSFDPAADGWEAFDHSEFLSLVGPVWRRVREEGTAYGLLVESKHGNRNGVAHGGVVTTMLDVGLGRTSSAAHGGRPQSTISLDVQFLGPVRIGDFAAVEAEVVRQTRSIVFLRGELRVCDEVRATAQGIWKILGA
jgi:uncharacterized protein (TIGR00369 family)